MENNSYKSRVYESVDDRSFQLVYISKIDGEQNSCNKGLIMSEIYKNK